MSITLEEIEVPQSVEGPEATDFVEYVRVRNEVEAATLGTKAFAMSPLQLRPEFASNPHRARQLFAARVDGQIVGCGMVTVRPHDLAVGAHLAVDVTPAQRGAGVGAALFETVSAAARAAGCTRLLVNTPHTVTPSGERIESSTEFGDVPAVDPGARFLVGRNFSLEQIVRISMLSAAGLDTALVPVQLASAEVAGPEYQLHTWHGATPPAWLDDLAMLRTRMSTDAPSGGVEARIDAWDTERIVAHDARVKDGGQAAVTVAVELLPSGRLVGFTELYAPLGGLVAVQEDTLVLTKHRGRRLGVLLKAVAGRALLLAHPQIEWIVTYNAEENRQMLDVNEQLGFVPVGYEGTWQHSL